MKKAIKEFLKHAEHRRRDGRDYDYYELDAEIVENLRAYFEKKEAKKKAKKEKYPAKRNKNSPKYAAGAKGMKALVWK